jgi:hypothetical protein
MVKLSISSWIGNAASVLCGSWGAVSRRAEQAGCSRQTIYKHASRVEAAVSDNLIPGPSREELLAENAQLRRENNELWAAWGQSIDFTASQQQQFVVTSSAMGLSLTQAWTLLAIILPADRRPSRATMGRWLATWCARASQVLQRLDNACRTTIVTLCIDEIFFRRQPVLVGVEPHSMAWVIGQRAENRNGATWCEALRPWQQLEYAVADAGSGLRKGLSLFNEARQQASSTLQLEVGLDVFHIKKEALPVIERLWKQTESVWAEAERADAKVARCRQQGKHAWKAASLARAAWNKAEEAFHQTERLEGSWRQAEQALELFRPDGQLNDRDWATTQISLATSQLVGPSWAKVCRMLKDPCALTFLDRMHRQLQAAVPNEELRAALIRLWWLRRQRHTASREQHDSVQGQVLQSLQQIICQRIDPEWQDAYRALGQVLLRTVRASSVVECMNSVIRMHQARHRSLTQPLMDLKRLFWNCRTFREGKRAKRSPYELLGLKLPTYDFWEILTMDPDSLAQKVSTAKIAA